MIQLTEWESEPREGRKGRGRDCIVGFIEKIKSHYFTKKKCCWVLIISEQKRGSNKNPLFHFTKVGKNASHIKGVFEPPLDNFFGNMENAYKSCFFVFFSNRTRCDRCFLFLVGEKKRKKTKRMEKKKKKKRKRWLEKIEEKQNKEKKKKTKRELSHFLLRDQRTIFFRKIGCKNVSSLLTDNSRDSFLDFPRK